MEKEKLDRINKLARKSRTQALSEEELAEQQLLRRAYIDEYKNSLRLTLENTYIQRADGSREKLRSKK